MTTDRVGLALSGGGFRATAFGLGCLRALHDTGVLSKVTVVSGISGGSLLAALWAYGPSSFQEFDGQVVELLERGLQLELSTRTLSPVRVARRGVDLIAAARPDGRGRPSRNRTDVLAALLADRAFGDKYLPDVTYAGLSTVLSATDLITSRAVRFGSDLSSLSTYGRIVEPIRVAEAVAASAAFSTRVPSRAEDVHVRARRSDSAATARTDRRRRVRQPGIAGARARPGSALQRSRVPARLHRRL